MQVITIAHRGASQEAPENTLPAIQKALDAGVDAIALEIQKTLDNQPIVLADVSLDRTTNGTGRVARAKLDEIRALDAGSWFGEGFEAAKVPTLAEAVAAVGDKARLVLTLPETRGDGPWTDALLAALKGRKKPGDDVLVFADSDSLKYFREKAPDFSYALALGEKVDGWLYLDKSEKLKLKYVRPHRHQIDAVLIRQAHAKNMQVLAHFANEESEIRALLELRVDGVITSRPERVKSALAGLKS